MRPGHHHFSPDYATARYRLLAACAARGLVVESRVHPLRGPAAEQLALDVVRIGPAGAPRRLALFAGTHGVEGYFGAALSLGLVEDGHLDHLPEGVSVHLFHALNPWGFAWTRRVTEDNVDFNRNWIDFGESRARDRDYEIIAAALLPPGLDPATLAAADGELRHFARTNGLPALQAAVTRGQYHHGDGLYFGGYGPTWSRRRVSEAVLCQLSGADHVVAIDCHTGLGAYGTGEAITIAAPGSAAYGRAKALFGARVKSTVTGESLSAHLMGSLDEGVAALLGDDGLTFVALEVGTRDGITVLGALRDDNFLHQQGGLDTEQGRAIKARLKDAFAPDEAAWQDAVYALGLETVQGVLAGI